MRERIAAKKRALAEKKAAQEQEELEKYNKEQADEGTTEVNNDEWETRSFSQS